MSEKALEITLGSGQFTLLHLLTDRLVRLAGALVSNATADDKDARLRWIDRFAQIFAMADKGAIAVDTECMARRRIHTREAGFAVVKASAIVQRKN